MRKEGSKSADPERKQRTRSAVLFLLAFTVSATLSGFAIDAIARKLDQEPAIWATAKIEKDLETLAQLNTERSTGSLPRVVILGDSTVAAYDEGFDIASLTEIALHQAGNRRPRVRVVHFASAARGIDTSLLLGDLVMEARPDLVVWQVSFAHFSRGWRRSFSNPEWVGWVSAERLPELLSYPIDAIGLNTASILLYQSIVRTGAYELWRDIRTAQIRVGRATRQAEVWLNPNTGKRPELRLREQRNDARGNAVLHDTRKKRFNATGERRHLGDALDGLATDHIMMQLLEFGVRSYTDRGVGVLVYLSPVNVEHLASEGILDVALLAKSIEALGSVVRGAGGHMLDLHDLFRDADFADAAGHFRTDQDHQVPRTLARRLATDIRVILDAERMSETD